MNSRRKMGYVFLKKQTRLTLNELSHLILRELTEEKIEGSCHCLEELKDSIRVEIAIVSRQGLLSCVQQYFEKLLGKCGGCLC
jgi:hypothetical protein